jgi:transcriptional regulator with XRE-family HTH domain
MTTRAEPQPSDQIQMDGNASGIEEDVEFYLGLGKAVASMRKSKGLSRKQLAVRAGVSYPYLSEIENGRKRLSARALLLVSRALDVKPFQLLEAAEALTDGGSVVLGRDEESLRSQIVEMVEHLASEDLAVVQAMLSRLNRNSY